METGASEGYIVNDACPPLARASAQVDACVEDTFHAGVAVTIHIESQDDTTPLKITCSNIAGATVSVELKPCSTIIDLQDYICDLCKWSSTRLFSDDGEDLVDLGQSVREFTRITAANSGDRKQYEHWKERYPCVGKVLAAMQVEAFNPRSENFHVRWRLDRVPDIEPEEFDALVDAQDPAINTDIDRSHYVQVLGKLVGCSEAWNLMNLQLLQNFDPGFTTLKHKFYLALLAVARDAVLPVEPRHPGVGAYFKRNATGVVIGCDMGARIGEYIDRNLQNSLNMGDLRLDRDWSKCTRYQLLMSFKGISWSDGVRLRHCKAKDQPTHKLDGAMSKEFCCMLLTIQLRLTSDVCPVSVNGDMTSDMMELLSESMGHCFVVLRSTGNVKDFVLDESSKSDGDANAEAKGLQAHLDSSLAKASSSGAFGSLIVVTGVSGERAFMLAPVCRRLKNRALPKSVHFILCEGFEHKAG